MTVTVAARGAAAHAIEARVPGLVESRVASRITGGDSTVWGAAAESDASVRLGWTRAVAVARPLVAAINELRNELRQQGVTRIVLCGMGGSSLAPEVITRTAGVDLTVLDATDPERVATVLGEHLGHTAFVVSSKSGTTVETDSHRRSVEAALRALDIEPADRIIVVTDPGSPLDEKARAAGYRVFTADPTVGGRYSALTAFGLVPSGLAGVDLDALLDEADAALLPLAVDSLDNPGLQLGAAIAGSDPVRGTLLIVDDGTHILGLGDWIEQLIAESTGKSGRGILPVVAGLEAPELSIRPSDVQVVRLVGSARATQEVAPEEIEVSGSLGAQLVTWQYATAVAGFLLGVNPFDQPDVESSKEATRALLNGRVEPVARGFVDGGIEVRGSASVLAGASTVDDVLKRLEARVPTDGYFAVHAYLDRVTHCDLALVRDAIAARIGRPATFGWGPRFLHSTGQYHKGGPRRGVFLQITEGFSAPLEVPGRPFGYAELIAAQAAGDAAVLEALGMPVVTLHLRGRDAVARVRSALTGR